MKKILVILMFVFLEIFPRVSYAQDIIPIPTLAPTVKYELAYPGMLPDSPFYKLKVLRNKIMLKLIQDPVKKAEYYLLLADKEIYMSKLLVNKGKIALAKETALKGENEYTMIVNLFKDVRKKPSKTFFKSLQTAALKHQEVLTGILAKVEGEDKKTFETVIHFSKINAEELTKLYTRT